MKTKKILFFIPTMHKGGAERVVSILANRFHKRSDVQCCLMMLDDDTVSYDIADDIATFTLLPGNKNSIIKLLEIPYAAFKLYRFMKKNDIDTVIAFLYRANYIACMSKLFGFRGKVIINVRSTTSRFLNEGLVGKINLLLVKSLFNLSDLIISNSKGVKEDLNRLFSVKKPHIYIYNPIDLSQVSLSITRRQQETFKFDPEKKYVIAVGRLIPLKRHIDLLKAFNIVHRSLPETELIVLGDGPLKETLQRYAKETNIASYVHFLGNVDNPFYFLHRSDLFVLTSELEGFPNVLLEAMACRTAVISSDCKSGPEEVLEKGAYGFLYPVGDIEKLTEYMLMLLTNDTLRKKYAELAAQRARLFDVDHIVKEYERVLLS